MKKSASLMDRLRAGTENRKGRGVLRFRSDEPKALGRLLLKNEEGECVYVIIDALRRKEKKVYLPDSLLLSGARLCSPEGENLCRLPKAADILCHVNESGQFWCEPEEKAPEGPDAGEEEAPVARTPAGSGDGPPEGISARNEEEHQAGISAGAGDSSPEGISARNEEEHQAGISAGAGDSPPEGSGAGNEEASAEEATDMGSSGESAKEQSS